jgi:hypothetical protein
MRVLIKESQFNLNWISFEMTVDDSEIRNDNRKIIAYPNPTNNLINFSGINQGEKVKIEIHDITGRLLKATEEKKINISNLPNGIYIAKVIVNGNSQELKILKK